MNDLGFVHRFIPGRSQSGTALLLLHGTGGNEEDLIPLGQTLAPGAALLSPRGKVLEHGMPRFFRRLAEGIFDIEDLKLRTHELADFVERARLAYAVGGKIIAVGYSNGANIAASLMLLHPGALTGAVLFRAMVPFVPEAPVELEQTNVLLAAGRRDPIASPDQTARLRQILERAGAKVSLRWHEGGHELGQDDVDAAQSWLQERT
jgi:phospholipase/carboxylesterase/glyoxalase family protein